jgi:hypothetical protein
MPGTATLRLDLTDVRGRRLGERVDIRLSHQTLASEDVLVKGVSAGKAVAIDGLRGAPQGIYRVDVDPPSYLPVRRIVSLASTGVTSLRLAFPVDPAKVRSVRFPAYGDLPAEVRRLLEASGSVFSFEGQQGQALYEALDDLRRAGFLNILAKARTTRLANGEAVLAHISELRELRGDRFFAVVTKALREETKQSVAAGLFRPVDGSLHHPPVGFDRAGSFKTEDRYGNLQLTFFVRGDEWLADIDIDDAAGLEHVFQVVRNAVAGRPTHPYDIHEILIAWQQTDPGYELVV